MNVSIRNGIAENKVSKMTLRINNQITLRARMELIVLKGLNILKERKLDKFTDLLFPKSNGNREEVTMTKSKSFQPSLR